jgi:hypothetical protein
MGYPGADARCFCASLTIFLSKIPSLFRPNTKDRVYVPSLRLPERIVSVEGEEWMFYTSPEQVRCPKKSDLGFPGIKGPVIGSSKRGQEQSLSTRRLFEGLWRTIGITSIGRNVGKKQPFSL